MLRLIRDFLVTHTQNTIVNDECKPSN